MIRVRIHARVKPCDTRTLIFDLALSQPRRLRERAVLQAERTIPNDREQDLVVERGGLDDKRETGRLGEWNRYVKKGGGIVSVFLFRMIRWRDPQVLRLWSVVGGHHKRVESARGTAAAWSITLLARSLEGRNCPSMPYDDFGRQMKKRERVRLRWPDQTECM